MILGLACSGLAPMQPAVADTLRCGSALIQPGDDARFVLEMCGEPSSGPTIDGAASTGDINGNVYSSRGGERAGRWRYRRVGRFPAVVVIGDNGRVEAIEFELGRRD
jgi:hypothetical protein